jgi:ribA/ribD-fused uncharacterized protein
MPPEQVFDLEMLRAAVQRGEVFEYRLFWSHRTGRDGTLSDACFSQWWPCTFTLSGVAYSSAEQYMMAEKARIFEDAEAREQILATSDPALQKQLGRQVRNYEEATWVRVRLDVVTVGNIAKFGQDSRLAAHLLATADAVLVEASPTDSVWGIGRAADDPVARIPDAWRGQNLLGFALMRARAALAGR